MKKYLKDIPYKPLMAVIFSSLILCFDALYNGFPITFNSDTACYLESGFNKVTWPDRSMLYGLFMYYVSFQYSLWLVVVIQALIVSLVVLYYFRYFAPHPHYLKYYMVFMIVTGIFMNLSFDVSRLLADVFAPVCMLCFGLLLFVKNIRNRDSIIVSLLAVLGIGMHNTVFFICLGLALVMLAGLLFKSIRQQYANERIAIKRILLCLSLAVAGNLFLASVHYRYGGKFKSSGSGAIFFMGNLVEMGVLDAYLAENCSVKSYLICHYRDTLPYNFLWAENSPIYKAGGWTVVNAEYTDIVKDILTTPKYLKNVVYKSALLTGKQFFQFDTGEADPPTPRVKDDIRIFYPNDYDQYTHAIQYEKTVNFDFVNFTKTILAAACFFAFILVFFLKKLTTRYRLFIVFLLVGMLINAWLCGTVSGVFGRYQARLIWLLPLPLFLYAMEYKNATLRYLLLKIRDKIKIASYFFAVFLLYSCGGSTSSAKDESGEKLLYAEQKNYVKVMVLEKGNFSKELVSNGKLRALKKSELKFIVGGKLKQLTVRNGMSVQAGQSLASVEQFEYRQKFEQAQTAVNHATMQLEDLVLARGFSLSDTGKIQRGIYERMLIRSGCAAARSDLMTARYNLNNTVLLAEFAGKVANIRRKKYEQINPGEVFCTLLDDAEFEVEFSLVETELNDLSLNDKVTVTPFLKNMSLEGYVSEINPIIDEHGLELVKALVKNRDRLLVEGMNVNVSVKKDITHQLVVPKSTIVLRQNQEVLFKYSRGKAVWVYVQTLFENSDTYAVTAHPEKHGSLAAGDTIIVSGNFNLAHDAPVVIK